MTCACSGSAPSLGNVLGSSASSAGESTGSFASSSSGGTLSATSSSVESSVTSGPSPGTSSATSSGSTGSADTSSRSTSHSGSSGATSSSGSSTSAAGVDAGLPSQLTLHVAGDSTSAIFPPTDPTKRVGWASVLQPFFGAGVTVDDAALSGRSSKSFIDEGHWTALKATIKPGDYVFIEFGHNDEKYGDALRYTDPSAGCSAPTPCFRDELKIYVNDTRAAGGVPVLLTPIARRMFSGTTVVNTHVTAQGDYPAAVVAVGAATGTTVIDMTARTTAWLEALGPTASVPMFATGDNTHLSATGAQQVAQLAVDGIRAAALPIAARLK